MLLEGQGWDAVNKCVKQAHSTAWQGLWYMLLLDFTFFLKHLYPLNLDLDLVLGPATL